jgi:hypothetical protein
MNYLMSNTWEYEKEKFEEGNVSRRIKKFLENEGYQIARFNDDKRAHGHDIEAIKNGEKLIVEVKGFPSDKYVSGPKKGKRKPTPPNLQAKHWFSEALFSLIMARSENLQVKIGLGLPDEPTYRKLIGKISYFRNIFGLTCYLVGADDSVQAI